MTQSLETNNQKLATYKKIKPRRMPGFEIQMVDRQGFEPWTLGLRVPCSTS